MEVNRNKPFESFWGKMGVSYLRCRLPDLPQALGSSFSWVSPSGQSPRRCNKAVPKCWQSPLPVPGPSQRLHPRDWNAPGTPPGWESRNGAGSTPDCPSCQSDRRWSASCCKWCKWSNLSDIPNPWPSWPSRRQKSPGDISHISAPKTSCKTERTEETVRGASPHPFIGRAAAGPGAATQSRDVCGMAPLPGRCPPAGRAPRAGSPGAPSRCPPRSAVPAPPEKRTDPRPANLPAPPEVAPGPLYRPGPRRSHRGRARTSPAAGWADSVPGAQLIPSALRRDTGGEGKPLPRVRVPLRAVPCLFRAGNTLSSPWPFRFPPQPTTPGEGPAAAAPSSRKRARGELCPGHAPCPKTRGPSPPGLSLSSGRFQEPTACPTGTVCSRIPSAVHSGRGLLSVGAASRSPQPRLVAEGRLYL